MFSKKFMEKMAALRESGEHSDFELRCGEQTIKVHKQVKEGFVELKEDHPDVVQFMVDYMYTGNYYDCKQVLKPEKPQESIISAESVITNGSENVPTEQATNTPNQNNKGFFADIIGNVVLADATFTGENGNDSDTESIACEIALLPDAIVAQSRNVAVFAMGEKFLVPELQTLALEGFKARPFDTWIKGVSEIISAVYISYPSSDKSLQKYLVATSAKKMPDSEDEEYNRTLKSLLDCHIEVLEKISSNQAAKIKELDAALQLAKNTIGALTRENLNYKNRVKALEHNISNSNAERVKGLKIFVDNLNEIRVSCRHCNAGMHVSADPPTSPDPKQKIIFRCSSCKTKY